MAKMADLRYILHHLQFFLILVIKIMLNQILVLSVIKICLQTKDVMVLQTGLLKLFLHQASIWVIC